MKGKFDLDVKFDEVTPENCFISEITLAELKFGVENSEQIEKNRKVLSDSSVGYRYCPFFIRWTYMLKRKHGYEEPELPLMNLIF